MKLRIMFLVLMLVISANARSAENIIRWDYNSRYNSALEKVFYSNRPNAIRVVYRFDARIKEYLRPDEKSRGFDISTRQDSDNTLGYIYMTNSTYRVHSSSSQVGVLESPSNGIAHCTQKTSSGAPITIPIKLNGQYISDLNGKQVSGIQTLSVDENLFESEERSFRSNMRCNITFYIKNITLHDRYGYHLSGYTAINNAELHFYHTKRHHYAFTSISPSNINIKTAPGKTWETQPLTIQVAGASKITFRVNGGDLTVVGPNSRLIRDGETVDVKPFIDPKDKYQEGKYLGQGSFKISGIGQSSGVKSLKITITSTVP